jgi:glycolate oxidase FAD binding subunit
VKPESIADYQEIVRTHKNILIQGGGSKPALSAALPGATTLEMGAITGIIEYKPGEYTFTAYAATAVSHIQQELADNNQYLPFDPLFVEAGATLAGTVAANSCGSGRYRYGGVRDFILGIQFIDGQGRLIRSGGKVVKNAAGFDLPKFMVGSLGRYGALVELTFKVFPKPPASHSLILQYENITAVVAALFRLAPQPFEMEALDVVLGTDGRPELQIRLGGMPDALRQRLDRLQNFLTQNTAITNHEQITEDNELWQAANSLNWATKQPALVKVPLTPRQIPELDTAVAKLNGTRRYTNGGNIAWIALDNPQKLAEILNKLGLVGLILRGSPGQYYIGQRQGEVLAKHVKQALDPTGTFLPDSNLESIHAA